MNLLATILEKSSILFMRYGIKCMTMDDIAKELAMSKKTLYQVVDNKSDLVYKTMELHIERENEGLEAIKKVAQNAVDEMLLIIEMTANHLQGVDSNIIFELQKYFPKAFDLFNDYRENQIRVAILENIKRGVKEGMYRDDFDAEIIAKIYIETIPTLFNPQNFPSKKYPFVMLYNQFVNYHLHGILSPKGLQFFEKKKRKTI